jgi:hypothetical protein
LKPSFGAGESGRKVKSPAPASTNRGLATIELASWPRFSRHALRLKSPGKVTGRPEAFQ